MERSDEARREDDLYDRIGSLGRKNEKLEKRIKELETENKQLKKINKRFSDICA